MKHVETNPYGDPETAARKLVELAAGIEAVQDGGIYIERVNVQFVALLSKGSKGAPEFGNAICCAVDRGWLWLHESGHLSEADGAGPGPAALNCEKD